MVQPMHSCPCCRSSSAATLLSTPPLMAASTFAMAPQSAAGTLRMARIVRLIRSSRLQPSISAPAQSLPGNSPPQSWPPCTSSSPTSAPDPARFWRAASGPPPRSAPSARSIEHLLHLVLRGHIHRDGVAVTDHRVDQPLRGAPC